MKYNYSELSPNQFEEVAIHLCYELLGMATQTFSEGPDGGRDSRFEGVAECYPSQREPWNGLTVIQAKHTNSYNSKFRDSSFFGSQTSTLGKEVNKIKKLIADDSLKNYLIVSNRKLSATTNEEILNYLSVNTGLAKENIGLIGIESMESYFKKYSSIPAQVGLNPFDMPINIEPDDLAEVIISIKAALPEIKKKNIIPNLKRTNFEDKNTVNNLSSGYANILKRKMTNFYEIQDFLAMPENQKAQEIYMDSSEEIHAKICAFKNTEHVFDNIIESIIDLIIKRDNDCKSNKRLTRVMIYYMYYRCDIGESNAVTA
ncbi:MAG: hypothetical protein D3923_05940 [Candidatus Electrothrix sp. AR3]|nr:hypothetical protein [Candidatus Electrothrix sp. AR3]